MVHESEDDAPLLLSRDLRSQRHQEGPASSREIKITKKTNSRLKLEIICAMETSKVRSHQFLPSRVPSPPIPCASKLT